MNSITQPKYERTDLGRVHRGVDASVESPVQADRLQEDDRLVQGVFRFR